MWTQPFEDRDRQTAKIKIKKEVRHLSSVMPGAQFNLHSWQAEGITPQRHLLFIHGALGHAQRHSEMLEWLLRRSEGKMAMHAIDLIGHGLSTGPRAYVQTFRHWVEDTISVYQILASQGPLAVMGHSMGGLIALKTILEYEPRIPKELGPLVLCNPCIRPYQLFEVPKIALVLEVMAKHLPLFRYPRLYKGSDLVNDTEAANAFETDPLIPNFITSQMVREIWSASQQVRPLSYFLKRPALFLLADQDTVVDSQATLLFTRGIDKQWAKVIQYEDVRHELLHEANRREVWRDVASWLEAL